MKILQKGIFILGLLSTCSSLINAAEANPNPSDNGQEQVGFMVWHMHRNDDGTVEEKRGFIPRDQLPAFVRQTLEGYKNSECHECNSPHMHSNQPKKTEPDKK